jgi:predicted alpha-1,2-mannosidase
MSSILRTVILALASQAAVLPAALAAPDASHVPPPDAKQSAAAVKREFLHAWRNYEHDAWGHDALKPLSRKPHDWYAQSLMMTPVDGLDTLLVMGLKQEADKDRELIATRLSFDQDIDVKNFEVTIRLLGGLLSGYQLSGDARLLKLADDLGRRLLPAFETPTGLPYVYVNLRTGKAHGVDSNPAETGSLLLEFGTLSRLTGNPVYYDKAKRALVETFKRRSKIGLVGAAINVETGQWSDVDASVASGTDSYYEYLWKCWKLFGDEDCLAMWKTSITAINRYLADDIDGKLWYGHADMNTGKRTATEYGALDAFFPAVLAMSGDIDRARRLQESGMRMWNLTGIEPEVIDYRTMKISQDGYQLRPEIIESNYYLWHYTDDPLYRQTARKMFDDFVRWCRTANGYAALSNVTTKTQRDSMESYVFAETFKYFYLTFAEPAPIDFEGIVFNTEAHPLRATWKQNKPAPAVAKTAQPGTYVNPLIGSRNGGNTFPGAVLPFGMLAWSPETSKGEHNKTAAPGGYEYDARRVRGFSLTHLSGTGCRGASGDIPFMPITSAVTRSPSADDDDSLYASTYDHAQEVAKAGRYQVRLDNGVQVDLSATQRTGAARFSYPAGVPATMLIRVSDAEVGSSDAQVAIDSDHRTVSGAVTSGNFCGYLSNDLKRSYYTLYFVAEFDQPFSAHGTWHDGQVQAGLDHAGGGTGYGAAGIPDLGHGSGAYVGFDGKTGVAVNVRVGISYVSLDNARANLQSENPRRDNVDAVAQKAAAAWDASLGRIEVGGGSADQLTTFYTALYHALLHPNLYSDADGSYRGFDGRVHRVSGPQQAQYANFSGWDIYRSQLQLVTWLDPQTGADIAQSLLNQATQNGGEWDRWTHNAGATHVMNGDPAAPAVAAIDAFGGTGFDARGALDSLVHAATQPTANDRSSAGCPVACVGQRPVLDQWLKLHYIPANSNSWAGAAETLESVSADFGIAMLAQRLGDTATTAQFLARADYWRNVFNPRATAHGGYIQDRNADGSWTAFDPAGDDGFVEGSAAQYLWMVPFNVRGLADALGGDARTNARLDAYFRHSDGSWALTRSGGLHSELDNEPSTGAPWLYNFTGRPYRTQETLREILDTLWKNQPEGIPGNDDLGAMSAWYVWSALGLYPALPGRAELLLSSPLFSSITVKRPGGDLSLEVQRPDAGARYIQSLAVDGKPYGAAYLPEALALRGGHLLMRLGTQARRDWGSAPADAPPSFAPLQN